MKNAKRILALMLVVAMVFAFGTTAFAANDGSITIRNATVGQDYEAYKVFDLTYTDKENGEKNVSYSYTTSDGKALDTTADAFAQALAADGSPFTLSETSQTGKYNVSTTENADTIAAWLNTNNNLLGTATAATPTGGATSSVVEFTGLPYGYYYITSELGSLVTIDSTLKDVKVIDKNEVPTWDNEDPDNPDSDNPNPGKVIIEEDADGNEVKVTQNDAAYGDDVNFSIAVNATAWVKDVTGESDVTGGTKLATYYYIQDTLEPGFDPAEDIVITVTEKDGTENTLTPGTDCTLIQNGNFFQVTVPFGEKYGANAVIEVRYTATVNDEAELAGDTNDNTAEFGYKTENIDPNDPKNPDGETFDPADPDDPDNPFPDDPYKPITPTIPDPDNPGEEIPNPDYPKPGDDNYPEDPTQPVPDPDTPAGDPKTTETYVFALGIVKVDGTSKEVLPGAEFKVEVDGTAIQAYPVGNGVYEYFSDDSAKPDTITSSKTGTFVVGDTGDNKGELVIKGLPEGTYTVTETNPPSGYNLLKTPVNVVLESNKTTTAQIGDYTVACKAAGTVVENNAGTEMPSTGGMGTTLFYVIGAILVCGAGVLLVTRRRMSKAK